MVERESGSARYEPPKGVLFQSLVVCVDETFSSSEACSAGFTRVRGQHSFRSCPSVSLVLRVLNFSELRSVSFASGRLPKEALLSVFQAKRRAALRKKYQRWFEQLVVAGHEVRLGTSAQVSRFSQCSGAEMLQKWRRPFGAGS